MQVTVAPFQLGNEPIYLHFLERQDSGQFDRYNPDMQSFVNRVWNLQLGTVAAMSHSGIGAETTNGFIQFVADNPMMFTKLITHLVAVRDSLPRNDQPTIEIRSKSVPSKVVNDSTTHYLTVMFRTPRFNAKTQANEWWSKLVQSYS